MKPKLLLYCTKANPYLLHMPKDNEEFKKGIEFSLTDGKEFAQACIDVNNYKLNGKIVAECDFEVEEIKWEDFPKYTNDGKVETFYMYATWKCPQDYILEHSCLTFEQLDNYLGGNNGYAIHIKNLHIFDEPKELSEYYSKPKKMNTFDWYEEKGYTYVSISIDKAPQNMMKCIDVEDNEYILISIQSQWLCKILNGEKTIEVRKKVLKEML